jgi:uncharacterized membrane protein
VKDGLIGAVTGVGAVLAEHVPPDAANPNEIPDAVAELPRP